MANKSIFSNTPAALNVPPTTTFNNAGGAAYEFTDKHKLAQIACTNCFNGTYYADASANLQLVKDAVGKLKNDPTFIAKLAVYCRDRGNMKDMPAYLTAVLATLDSVLFRKVFTKVIDNGKMLRNFIQIGRSGEAGRKLNMSAGACRHAIRDWFASRNSYGIFRASIGNDPSMRDILRMAHVAPDSPEKAALYAYLAGAEYDKSENRYVVRHKNGGIRYQHSFSALPEIVQQFENFKRDRTGEIPNVDFRMLDSILNNDQLRQLWANQARNGGWQATRMNLNNFAKYGVFQDKELVKLVADRLSSREEVLKSKAFPYQLMMAYNAASSEVPTLVKEALQDAMEVAIDNVPSFGGKIYVCVDTSGSMGQAITGNRGTVTSAVRCVDVAGLFAAATVRRNKDSEVLPFDTSVHHVDFNPRDTVITNAKKFARNGGGTDCGCAMRELNNRNAKGDAVIFVSDNESWVNGGYGGRGTGLMSEWTKFKARNKAARLVCIDLTPRDNSQASEHKDILQVGGFGDAVFDVVASFIKHGLSNDHWLDVINAIDLNAGRKDSEEVVIAE